jgi:hypothetical protein
MTSKKERVPSPESLARANRQRTAFEEGLKAMAAIEHRSVHVRENMARLRALREAKEADTQKTELAAGAPKPKAKRKSRA